MAIQSFMTPTQATVATANLHGDHIAQ